ncbi:MAG: hypothetical protein II054_09625 [Treponema sp.]|nr:hypothetical protein [Treponema sp.]
MKRSNVFVRAGIGIASALMSLFLFGGCILLGSVPRTAVDTSGDSYSSAVVEGVWKQSSTGNSYEIAETGGAYTLTCFTLKSNGERSYSSNMTTFEKGAKKALDSRHGYLYGYNKNRPGWIAYYYTLSGDNLNLTQVLNDNGGATWSSIDDAKALADISKPGAVKMDLTR